MGTTGFGRVLPFTENGNAVAKAADKSVAQAVSRICWKCQTFTTRAIVEIRRRHVRPQDLAGVPAGDRDWAASQRLVRAERSVR